MDYFVKGTNNESGTFTALLADDETSTAHLTPVPNKAPGYITIEIGTDFEEEIYYQTKDDNAGTISTLTRDVSGLNGGNGRQHENGAAWETAQSVTMINKMVDGILVEHSQTGTHTFTAVKDTNGNESIKTPATTSAVNEITVTNAATGNAPVISATGGDDKIALGLAGKAAFVKATGIYDCGTVGATETVSWKNGDRQKMTLDENLTITFGDAVEGQTLTLYMLQDETGTNTITFADTIVWADATTPTWTTTASKMNIAVITYIGSAYYGVANKFA